MDVSLLPRKLSESLPGWFRENACRKHLSPKEAAFASKWLRHAGAPVVFTNGCFDCLHRGHLRLLNYARRQGAALFVAVNSDASVRRLKGPGRPIQPLKDRLNVLRALTVVDYLVVFGNGRDGDSPAELCSMIQPDVLVKGEATPFPILGAGHAKRLLLVTEIAGVSTTETLHRMEA